MPPMLMTSSSGCGLKTRHGLRLGRRPGCVQIVRHHLVEDAPAQRAGRAVLAQQFVQLVLAEVVVGELEQRLADLQAQPDDGPADQRRRPVDRADHPRPANRRQLAGRRLVEQEGRVGVLLQEAGGDGVGDRPPRRPCWTIGALCSPKAMRTILRASRMVPTPIVSAWCGTFSSPKKLAGRVAARHRVERDQARAAVPRRAGLVEADVAGAADAEDLQVDAAGPADHLLVARAVVLDVARRRSCRRGCGCSAAGC